MAAATGDDQDSALRPLRNVATTMAALRTGSLSSEDSRGAVIQVAAAVEMSLRRLLRDFPAAALQVRLRALAPDELRADEVLAELRQHDQISIELAAAVHDLLEVRHRLREGAPLAPQDATLAYHVADRLEHEANRARSAPVTPPPAPSAELDEAEATVLNQAPRRRSRRLASTAGDPGNVRLAVAGVLVLILVALGVWWAVPRGGGELQEGITRFRMGEYEEAADHFARHAASNPRDATARLYLARIHRRMARPNLAVAQLDTALQLAPQDADVQAELGFLLIDTGHPAEAVERFRSALRIDGDSEAAWVGLVTALRRDGRPDAAERVLERAPAAVRSRMALPDSAAALP